MTTELILSLVAIAISIVLPVGVMYWSLSLNTSLQERLSRENALLQEKLEKSVLRPTPIATLLLDTSASLNIHPQNLGNAIAHDYTISVRYPSESEIKSIKNEFFDIKEGGIGEDFVKFFKEQFLPTIIFPPIHIEAERAGKVVLPKEVSVVCLEQKGMISLPPYRE